MPHGVVIKIQLGKNNKGACSLLLSEHNKGFLKGIIIIKEKIGIVKWKVNRIIKINRFNT